jgi:hypothetical protein
MKSVEPEHVHERQEEIVMNHLSVLALHVQDSKLQVKPL